jgi:malate synthase
MTVQRKLIIPDGVSISGQLKLGYEKLLTQEALEFLARLHRGFEKRRRRLMERRRERQALFDAGRLPDFLPETKEVREGQWTIGPIPADLLDRRVEITGPTDRKMIINALNSGARVFMADFEDANSPSWDNVVEGQLNLIDRWQGRLDFTDPQSGKHYRVSNTPAVLMVRPRGWHLPEKHMSVDGEPVAGALFDFGLYFFHNARASLEAGSGPYFYLPKMESHLEARLWNDVFSEAQKAVGMARGTIKTTVLIETLPAAFEMHEILHELKDHITGLNCGRWDYIFSFIKTLKAYPDYVLPDRSQVVMSKAFLAAYSELLIQTCHRRGAFAMGGMAAQIPNRKDPKANEAALAKVRADKEREARNGHDGTWVAHPDLVPVAIEVFDRFMPSKNQLHVKREDVGVGQRELLTVHAGTKTEGGFRENIRIGVQYVEAWLRGRGAVPLYNLMEDAATAEIGRTQIWQWLNFGATLEGGQKVTQDFFERCLEEELATVRSEAGGEAYDGGRFEDATWLFRRLSTSERLEPFLTLPAYEMLE